MKPVRLLLTVLMLMLVSCGQPPAAGPRVALPEAASREAQREPDIRLKMPDGTIRTLPMERYLRGVLASELFPDWHPVAFEAQAIASRSYALWSRARARADGKPHDVTTTTGSQVWAGPPKNPAVRAKVDAALARTRGRVLTWRGRLFPAFFSSSHGTRSADGHRVFPFSTPDIPPLRGRELRTWDARSPRFRWPAVRRPAAAVLAAAVQRGHVLVRDLEGRPVRDRMRRQPTSLSRIHPVAWHGTGRVAQWELDRDATASYRIRSNDLRHAFNAVPGTGEAFSGDFDASVERGSLVLRNGRGHGHGVGLSQYGAQAMAEAGHDAARILGVYYPGADLTTMW